MHALRALLFGHRRIAILVMALALGMKALLPAGYMLSSAAESATGVLTLALCHEGGKGATVASSVAVPAGKAAQDGHDSHAKADGQCPYSSLSMAALGGASAPLLALALAFILALGLVPARRLPFGPIAHLRPPLRGPPAHA